MKLRNDTSILRSAYLFGGLTLTKSEIRKVEIVPWRQIPRCRAGYGGPVTETMGMCLTKGGNCTPKYTWQQSTPRKTHENSEFSENNNNKVPSNKIPETTPWLFISAPGFWLISDESSSYSHISCILKVGGDNYYHLTSVWDA